MPRLFGFARAAHGGGGPRERSHDIACLHADDAGLRVARRWTRAADRPRADAGAAAGRGGAELRAPDRTRLWIVPYRLSTADAVRTAVQAQRLYPAGTGHQTAGAARMGASGVGHDHLRLHAYRHADGQCRIAAAEERQCGAAAGELVLRRRAYRAYRRVRPGHLCGTAVRTARAQPAHVGQPRRTLRRCDERQRDSHRLRHKRQQQPDGPGRLEHDSGLGLPVRGVEPLEHAGRPDPHRQRLRRPRARRHRVCLHQRHAPDRGRRLRDAVQQHSECPGGRRGKRPGDDRRDPLFPRRLRAALGRSLPGGRRFRPVRERDAMLCHAGHRPQPVPRRRIRLAVPIHGRPAMWSL
jgi:hypothetical protein